MLPFEISSLPAYHHVNIMHVNVNKRYMFSPTHTTTKPCCDCMLHFAAYPLLSCKQVLCMSFQMCKSPYLRPFHESDSPLKAFFLFFFFASCVWNQIIDSFTHHRRRLWAEPGGVCVCVEV